MYKGIIHYSKVSIIMLSVFFIRIGMATLAVGIQTSFKKAMIAHK